MIMNTPQFPKWNIRLSLILTAFVTLAGSASAQLTITTTNQHGALPFTPTWTPAPGSLIAGVAPTTTTGNFSLDDTNRNVNSLTSGGSLMIDTHAGNAPPDNGNATAST